MGWGQLMLMMLAFGVEWPWGRAADAHDAGFWCGMAMGWGQLMLMMLAFGVEWPWGRGS